MSLDPYAVLEVSPSATDDEVKKAYRRMAKKYHPDIHPEPAIAEKKMAEINAAYDQIQAQRQRKTAGAGYQYGYEEPTQGATPEMTAVRHYLHYRRFQEAFNVLNRMTDRTAEWYFLAAYAHEGVGNRTQALEFARKAVMMEPDNVEYRAFLNRLELGGMAYQTYGREFRMPHVGGWDKLCLAFWCLKCFCPYC